jgi:hypothetical protein
MPILVTPPEFLRPKRTFWNYDSALVMSDPRFAAQRIV